MVKVNFDYIKNFQDEFIPPKSQDNTDNYFWSNFLIEYVEQFLEGLLEKFLI